MSKSVHGLSGTTTYNIWANMLQRCNNPKNTSYKNYGAKGIRVCDRWHSFVNFYADMGERPLKLQIDRIDNDKGYSPDNCRWISAEENHAEMLSRRKNSTLERSFGRWEVLGRTAPVGNKKSYLTRAYYLCRCNICKHERVIGGELLRKQNGPKWCYDAKFSCFGLRRGQMKKEK